MTTADSTKSIDYANQLILTKSMDKVKPKLSDRADLYKTLLRYGYSIQTIGNNSPNKNTQITLNFQVKNTGDLRTGINNRIGYKYPNYSYFGETTDSDTTVLNNGPPSIIADENCDGKFTGMAPSFTTYDMNDFLNDNYTKIEVDADKDKQPKICYWILNVELLYLSTRYTNFDKNNYAKAIHTSIYSNKPFDGFDELTFNNGSTVSDLMVDATKYINDIGINNVLSNDNQSRWYDLYGWYNWFTDNDKVLLNKYIPTSVFDTKIGFNDENKTTNLTGLYGFITDRNIQFDKDGLPINITQKETIKLN
jgi:hypothetical protein